MSLSDKQNETKDTPALRFFIVLFVAFLSLIINGKQLWDNE